MRQIKFRAWDRKRKRWIYEFSLSFDYSSLDIATLIIWTKNEEGFDESFTNGETCDLVQLTGLTDKKGKEIYEGDWLKDDQGILYQAKFGKLPLDKSGDCVCTYEAFYAEARDSSASYKCTEIAEWMTVIGNIYENKWLLK